MFTRRRRPAGLWSLAANYRAVSDCKYVGRRRVTILTTVEIDGPVRRQTRQDIYQVGSGRRRWYVDVVDVDRAGNSTSGSPLEQYTHCMES